MDTRLIKSLQQVEELLQATPQIQPGWKSKDECYQWIAGTLKHFRYRTLGKPEKGLIKRYLIVASGYSRAQITRLIKEYLNLRLLKRKQRTTKG
ncbi:hypothetical protein, partial [Endozoicomonas ascidiicola]|uniref:hypothetical protein n=1 Tax=Endozoicomonas ascidiicola TaxID=1698521 RepID=UPI001C12CAC0